MHPYSKGSSLLRDWDITNPCRPPRAPHRRYTIILNSAINFCLISNMCASVHADFCRPKGLKSAQTRSSTCSVWNRRTVCERNPALFSVWKNNLIPIPFASAVLDVLNIFTLWKFITLALIAINDYRPASQAVFSVVYTSVTTVRQYYFQCRQTIYRCCHTGAYIYHDYRLALQAVFSVIYM